MTLYTNRTSNAILYKSKMNHAKLSGLRLQTVAQPPHLMVVQHPVSAHCTPSFSPTKKESFTTAHAAITAAWLRKHHLIIHVGAGPVQLVYGLPPLFATDAAHHRILFFFTGAVGDIRWLTSLPSKSERKERSHMQWCHGMQRHFTVLTDDTMTHEMARESLDSCKQEKQKLTFLHSQWQKVASRSKFQCFWELHLTTVACTTLTSPYYRVACPRCRWQSPAHGPRN